MALHICPQCDGYSTERHVFPDDNTEPCGICDSNGFVDRECHCRRCAGCPDQCHHWLEGGPPWKEDGAPVGAYACKHCDALGNACEACGADPEFDDEPTDCDVCGGCGIAEVT
jgi:hypothetical protein